MSKSQYRARPKGSRVSVSRRRVIDEDGIVETYDLVINIGKSRKRAESLRRKVEKACREILTSDSE